MHRSLVTWLAALTAWLAVVPGCTKYTRHYYADVPVMPGEALATLERRTSEVVRARNAERGEQADGYQPILADAIDAAGTSTDGAEDGAEDGTANDRADDTAGASGASASPAADGEPTAANQTTRPRRLYTPLRAVRRGDAFYIEDALFDPAPLDDTDWPIRARARAFPRGAGGATRIELSLTSRADASWVGDLLDLHGDVPVDDDRGLPRATRSPPEARALRLVPGDGDNPRTYATAAPLGALGVSKLIAVDHVEPTARTGPWVFEFASQYALGADPATDGTMASAHYQLRMGRRLPASSIGRDERGHRWQLSILGGIGLGMHDDIGCTEACPPFFAAFEPNVVVRTSRVPTVKLVPGTEIPTRAGLDFDLRLSASLDELGRRGVAAAVAVRHAEWGGLEVRAGYLGGDDGGVTWSVGIDLGTVSSLAPPILIGLPLALIIGGFDALVSSATGT